MSKILAGISGMQAANYNARAAETEGQMAVADGVATEARIRDEARMAAGEAVAAQAQSGLQIGTGSALDVLRESAVTAELDKLTVRARADNVRRAKAEEARMQRKSGRMALLAGIIGTAEDAVAASAGGGSGGSGGFDAAAARSANSRGIDGFLAARRG